VRVRELAEWLGVTFEGDGEKEITGVAPLETAGAAELSFVAGRKAGRSAEFSAAGCLIVPPEFPNPGRTVIRAAEPRTAFARAVNRLAPPPAPEPGIHPRAWVAPTAELGPGVSVGPGCVVGHRVTIGEGSVLHANVTIYSDVEIGKRAVLHSGCVIGADGFGFVMTGGRYEKFPQIGRVVIGDDVEIGANSCVDRAALGVTWIGDGVKLDNLVHVAHNCRIGRHVVVAAQTGFSGGVVVEDYAVIGGQVGIGDKARIESGAVLGSGSGILSSKVVHGGQVMWGTPARPLKEHLEQLANLARLPELRREFAELKRRLDQLAAERRPE
jgi:UDP-3-O-[3-hydroxymyristoyl] glucosamine N-acyltransferase